MSLLIYKKNPFMSFRESGREMEESDGGERCGESVREREREREREKEEERAGEVSRMGRAIW